MSCIVIEYDYGFQSFHFLTNIDLFEGPEWFKCLPCGTCRKEGLTEIRRHEFHKVHRRNSEGYQCLGKAFTPSEKIQREKKNHRKK